MVRFSPAPKIAKRIEQRMSEVGRELFRLVLGGSEVWENARRFLVDTRILEVLRPPTLEQLSKTSPANP